MADARDVATKYTTERPRGWREASLARLAERQHGVVSVTQLRELDLSPSAIRDRAAAGRLHRLHRGVYAVGHPLLPPRGRWMAAVLACGRDAVLSHRSAAALWAIRPTARSGIDVTAPGPSGPAQSRHRGT